MNTTIDFKQRHVKIKTWLILLYLFIFVVQFGFSQETKKVLFIGNSQTFYNDLPAITSDIATSLGDVLTYEESTIPGFSLQQHLNKPETMNKIRKGGWEYVILQERSSLPSLWASYVEQNVHPYVQQMKDFILEHNPCAKIILYHTWGYKLGNQAYCSTFPNVCDYVGMDNELQKRFKEMQTKFNAILSPVGPVWRTIRNFYPDIELFDPDNYHPSLKGSYTGALTFYTIIFEKDASSSTYNPGIPINEVANIKNAVKQVSFDNLTIWRDIKLDADVTFDYQIGSNLEVTFTNNTTFADSYQWDFGDGTTSTEKSPKHTFTENGNYTVKLTVNRCQGVVQINETISVGTLSINDFEKNEINIYPNPAKEILQIKLQNPDVEISVYSIEGKLLIEKLKPTSKQYLINVSSLKAGVYILNVISPDNIKAVKNKLFVIR